MSMSHKAFVFDWTEFVQDELHTLLPAALASGDTDALVRYIDANLDDLADPYEGEPLTVDWEEMLRSRDVQELADFAMTRFYDPTDDRGLWDQWRTIDARLPPEDQAALRGEPFATFDPGRQGSCFQTPQQVAASLARARGFDLPDLEDYQRGSLDRFLELLAECEATGSGLYVTF